MKNTIRILALLICLTVPLWGQGLVALAIDPPASDPTVSNLHVNRNLLVTGDVLFYGEYDIPYATADIPDVFADQSFMFQLISTDNVTILGIVRPYVFFDNGYNNGVFSFYFSSMTTANITWGVPYVIRILENPAQFASPESFDYVMPTNVYTSASTTEANRTELEINIISAANRLESEHTGYTLLDTAAGGTVLSSPTGETYFRGAIYGVQAMAPGLFMVQVLEYDTTYRTWTTEYSENLTSRWDTTANATWIAESQNATATQFGVTPQTAMGVIPLILCVGAIITSSMKWRRIEPGLIVSAVVLIMALLLGWLSPAIFASLFQLMGVYIAYLIFLARAG